MYDRDDHEQAIKDWDKAHGPNKLPKDKEQRINFVAGSLFALAMVALLVSPTIAFGVFGLSAVVYLVGQI